jgi:tRNA threonylcarbamoyladenosine biosynthesis protein TsaE
MQEILSASEEDTSAAGEALGRSLRTGAVILLHGELGAGKTAFVRGLARGVEAPAEDVTSPTFTLIQQYSGRLPLHHVDLYRLASSEVEELGLDDLLTGDAVVAIEWAERWAHRPADAIEVRIDDAGGDRRTIRITRPAPTSHP